MRAAIAGTFNVLHEGHKALIDKAFDVSDEVLIGITSDAMASDSRSTTIPFAIRKKAVEDHVKEKGNYEIFEIEDMFGPAVEREDIDILVVSEETYFNGILVNEERIKRNLRPMSLIVVAMRSDRNGETISSRNILSGKCSRSGNTDVPDIAVGSDNPVKVEAVRTIMEKIFGEVKITPIKVTSGVSEQPWGEETLNGAINRARSSLQGHDLAVGIEAGVFKMYDGIYDIQHCAIVDKEGRVTIGMGPGFRYPDDVAELLKKGKTVGEAMSLLYSKNRGRGEGAIGVLSKGILDRKSLTEQAVLAAMIPRLSEK